MREFTKRFADFEKLPTHKAINADLMFLFGITMQDFFAALVVFFGLCLLPGFLTPFLALACALWVLFLSKKMRSLFPRGHFRHLLWAWGLSETKVIKNPFRKARRRWITFGP